MLDGGRRAPGSVGGARLRLLLAAAELDGCALPRWQTQPVRLAWSYDTTNAAAIDGDCSPRIISTDTAGTVLRCKIQDAMDSSTTEKTATVKVDVTAPNVTVVPARPPDHDGWWTRPVTFGFVGSDATSGMAACDSVMETIGLLASRPLPARLWLALRNLDTAPPDKAAAITTACVEAGIPATRTLDEAATAIAACSLAPAVETRLDPTSAQPPPDLRPTSRVTVTLMVDIDRGRHCDAGGRP